MHALSNIAFILVALFAAVVIFGCFRKMLAFRAQHRRRIERVAAPVTARSSEFSHANLHRAFFGTSPEVTSEETRAYRTRRMGEIIRMAGCSTDRSELIGAAIRLGCTNEVARHYTDLILNDPGDPLPAALASPPNIGGVGHLPYAGPNFVERDDLVAEMRTIQHFGTEKGA